MGVGVDLVPALSFKSSCLRLTGIFELEFKGRLYQNKVNFSLTFAQRLGH